MRLLTFALFVLSTSFAAAESITCYLTSACYVPLGECDPAEANTEPAVLEISKNQISVLGPGESPSLTFTVIEIATNSEVTSYFTENERGFTMFTLFDNGNLTMSATRNTNDGVAAIAYFTCEGAPWKTS